MPKGFFYVMAILDLHSRYVLHWQLSNTLEADGAARAVERFWRTLKYEDVYLRNYQTGSELRAGLSKYFQYYNYQRPHQSLGYRTPARVLMEGKEKQCKSVN